MITHDLDYDGNPVGYADYDDAPTCRCGDGPCECPARCERCDSLTDDGLSDDGMCEPCVIALETRP
jgi:hypothetical protein